MWTALGHLAARLRADRRAATAIEYALLGSLIAGAAMVGMTALGLSLDLLFTSMSGEIATSAPPPPPPRCIAVGSACPK